MTAVSTLRLIITVSRAEPDVAEHRDGGRGAGRDDDAPVRDAVARLAEERRNKPTLVAANGISAADHPSIV